MGSVHRNGKPPKRFQHKVVFSVPDYEWYEDSLVKWAKESAEGAVQYEHVMFQGSEKLSKRTVEVTVWFQKKKDAMLFKLSWLV